MEFIHTYNDEKQNYYNYKALNNLKDIENINDKIYNKRIYLCPYIINNEGMYPFLNFLLYKNNDTIINYLNSSNSEEKLNFPIIENSLFSMNFEELLLFSKSFIYNILNQNNFDKCENFENFIDYTGSLILENNVYLFLDLTKCKIKIYDIYKKNDIWFCLIDEIINLKNVCNIKIDNNVTNFFIKNNDFLYLYDSLNNKYNIPSTAYIGKKKEYLNFTYIFGVPKSDNNAILGPYYYFTDFNNAIEELKMDKESIGIIRFAIFTNNLLIKENYINDNNDISEIKKKRLMDDNYNKNYELLTMRISDHDATWITKFDSVYLGNIELDNGQYLKNTPMFVLKNYEQQISLSYHYINTKSIVNGNVSEYSIL